MMTANNGTIGLLDFLPPEIGDPVSRSSGFAGMGGVFFKGCDLSFEIDDLFHDGIGDSYHSRAGLERTLSHDEVGELLGKIDV
jgi:hypothetical protein